MTEKTTILILDDTKPIRILLLKKFEREFNCILAENVRDALTLVNEYGDKISLIISDYELPDFNGYDFLRQAQSKLKNVPVIMLSATLNEARIKDLMALGVKKFLAKPVNLNRLMQYVDTLLGRSEKGDP